MDNEQHRHRCEVRWVIATMDPQRAKKYAAGVAEKRGRAAALRLVEDVKAQAAKGNDGAWGAWL